MVCTKCQKKIQKTELATPGVKKKSEMYYGSPSTSVGGGGDASKSKPGSSATMGSTGIGKVGRPGLEVGEGETDGDIAE